MFGFSRCVIEVTLLDVSYPWLVLDENGRKMSTSVGNVVSYSYAWRKGMLGVTFSRATRLNGADALRLWVASSEYTSDVTIGSTILGKPRLSIILCQTSGSSTIQTRFVQGR